MNSKFAKSLPAIWFPTAESSPLNQVCSHPFICKQTTHQKWIYESLHLSNLWLKRMLKQDRSTTVSWDFSKEIKSMKQRIAYVQQEGIHNECTTDILGDLLPEMWEAQWELESRLNSFGKLVSAHTLNKIVPSGVFPPERKSLPERITIPRNHKPVFSPHQYYPCLY